MGQFGVGSQRVCGSLADSSLLFIGWCSPNECATYGDGRSPNRCASHGNFCAANRRTTNGDISAPNNRSVNSHLCPQRCV